MAIDDTPLEEEIRGILEGPALPVYAKWHLTLFTPAGDEITPLKLLSVDIERNYLSNFTDLTIVEAVFPLGIHSRFLVRHREELTALLVRYPKWGNDSEMDLPAPDNEGPIEYTFQAILLDESSAAQGVEGTGNESQANMDLKDVIRIQLQMIDPALNEIQKMEVGGIYRDEIPLNVVRYVLTQVSTEIEVSEEEAVYGVDMVEPDNDQPHTHVIIPHGTKPWDVAALVQKDGGGCYSTGIGCYLQDHHWYLWPQFNTKRFEDTEETLTVFNLPPWRYRGIEKTWRLTERQLIILATADSEHIDTSHHEQLNRGSGERFVHGDRIMDGFGEVEDNKFIADRKKNNSEYLAIEKPGHTHVGVADDKVSNNSFSHASQFAARKGSFVQLVWEYSRHEMIYPGMPIKYVFLDQQEELIELEGVVLSAHHFIHDPNPGFLEEKNFYCNTALTLFVEKYEP